ncbi:MAG: phenylalanine--tRNA ligase subunit beta [Alphaproteobacteria bacterium]
MKFTLSWLKRHLDTDASLEEIGEKLTSLGLELDEIDDPAELYAPFKVAYVEKAEKHPDADRLKVCTVKTEEGSVQVVCGAPNARAGMRAVFAPEGSYIPGLDTVLKKGVIRGVESCGMLVSESEMCISDDHDGIIDAPEDAEIGTPFAALYGMDDPVISIDLTPNRVDCAGVRGIARDLAASGLGTLKPLENAAVKGGFSCAVNVKIEDKEGCPLFLGRQIKGVKNGPSPEWMQRLLKAVGLRPISALVDITNFVSLDLCRPLHVYDVAKLKGDIVVREGQKGESFDALNDKSYTLEGGEVAITDESGLLGLGGIVGGESSGTDENTSDVFLECAYFTPARIAKTGRLHDIQSDARYRFERGIDPVFTFEGMEIATRLILDICGGKASEIVQAGEVPAWEKTVRHDPDFVEELIGMNVTADHQVGILDALGFGSENHGDHYMVSVPPWRQDIWAADTDGRADLAEEIMRVAGLDHLPSESVRADSAVPQAAETSQLANVRMARNALAARGLHECVTWSFMSKDLAALFGSNDNALTVSNPISSEIDQMRPSILPNLIRAAANNHDRGYPNAALCEVGPVFRSTKPDGQDMIAAGIRFGNYAVRNWAESHAARAVDAYDAKADVMAALEAVGAPAANAQVRTDAPDYYHPGRSATLNLGKNKIAQFGEIHPMILEEMDIKGPVVAFEIFLGNIPAPKKKGTEKSLLHLNPLQPLSKDFAFIVDESTKAEDLIRAAKTADKKLIKDAYIFDVYQGKGVEEGKKSLALNITIQPEDKTLTDEDIEGIMSAVIENIGAKCGGVLRG